MLASGLILLFRGRHSSRLLSGDPRPLRTPDHQDGHAPFRRLAANISPAYGPAHGATNGIAPGVTLSLSPAITASTGASSGKASSGGGPAPGAAPSDLRNQAPGQRIVVLVADNESTTMAVQLLMSLVKPGKDRVTLVTVVSSVLQEPAGRMLLRKHEMSLMKTMVEATS